LPEQYGRTLTDGEHTAQKLKQLWTPAYQKKKPKADATN